MGVGGGQKGWVHIVIPAIVTIKGERNGGCGTGAVDQWTGFSDVVRSVTVVVIDRIPVGLRNHTSHLAGGETWHTGISGGELVSTKELNADGCGAHGISSQQGQARDHITTGSFHSFTCPAALGYGFDNKQMGYRGSRNVQEEDCQRESREMVLRNAEGMNRSIVVSLCEEFSCGPRYYLQKHKVSRDL